MEAIFLNVYEIEIYNFFITIFVYINDNISVTHIIVIWIPKSLKIMYYHVNSNDNVPCIFHIYCFE
jgi:hypothetical protein